MENEVTKDEPVSEEAPPKLKVNKKLVIAAVVVLLLGGAAYFGKGFIVAATVNGSPISRFTLVRELEKRSAKAVLDSMIVERLIMEEAAKAGSTVNDEDVDGEIRVIESGIVAQGGTLEAALAAQNMSHDDLEKQIVIQLTLKKILGNGAEVTDQDVEQYIAGTGAPLPEGQEEAIRQQVREQLKQQKFSQAASAWIESAKASARIKFFVNY